MSQRQRLDGAIVNRRFNKAIKQAGGSPKAYPQAVIAETQELFSCDVNALYESTGGKAGDRSTLPVEAQEAYVATEALALHQLNQAHQQGNATDAAIVKTVQKTAKSVRKLLPW